MFKFMKEFMKSLKSIGSIAPSSKYLSNKMIKNYPYFLNIKKKRQFKT